MGGRAGGALLLLLLGWALPGGSRAAAFPDWTECPAVCRCKWTSGKKSAFCPDAGLTSLPASLDPDMQVLDLSGNQIPALQQQIFKHAGLVNLQKVFLRNAGIHQIHADAFRDMRILVEVDLSDNHVASLDAQTFAGNERLRLLVLSGNPIAALGPRQFPPLQHLRILELQRCALRRVHAAAFQQLPALESLSLDANQLEFLDADSVAGLKKLKTLGLDNNPWQCDCRLRDFCRLITAASSNRLYSLPQRCRGPERLKGRRWEEVKPGEFACEPTVTLPQSSIQEEINGNVSLACLASADPEPEVWWQLNGGPLNGSRRANDEVGPPGGIVTYSTSLETRGRLVERWSNLTIYNASDSDAGEYTCHARNVAGTARDTVAVSIPRVFTAPTLSQADNWLLWLSLAGGGTLAICLSASAVLLAVCLCGGASRRRTRRAKVKLQASASFGDQEKKLLDLSVTTTATGAGAQQPQRRQRQQGPQHEGRPGAGSPPAAAPVRAEFELELESRAARRAAAPAAPAASVTVERLRLQAAEARRGSPSPAPTPPPPLPAVVCPLAGIYIGVPLPAAELGPARRPTPPPEPGPAGAEAGARERCYPDLLDIGLSGFATLPRRGLGARRAGAELGSPYDNMGPRVTAAGSSTFSLLDAPEAAAPLIQPPPEFVSL
ncbi:leucine-rich repeat-containing protein 24-like [Phymastichus coffea]|uniref:leucine-rich repeat-containing protein 24-like n=1 Tax=Phymastichus coffea TaxID=108790 RepID=UPI00273B378B|nr:leucine-rich repeat-containing protein 24-like [Phymastichus coffea]